MNTSRDIEKLFDHFGGNAGDYQEIGREKEATTARTRWPLLATLDFAQPAIPEIAPRHDVQPNAARARPDEAAAPPAAHHADKPTPIHRGRQPLFTRPHRRTIPAVNPPAAESLSALRFSVLGESAPAQTETIPDSATVSKTNAAPVHTMVPPVESNATELARPAASFGTDFAARRTPAQVAPVTAAAPAAPQSILGKLFKPQTQSAPSASANSLDAMFERLRHARPQGDESTNTQARASRLSRS
ncbi:cellulose biosynthesis protein BcsP [Caballeronia sp. ATUFL_F2_KS9A]|uniref:cellulose biosynthesis protein BcsP n=1 Tax=Caballeronia sp. ATUFL_F2_KS9A TaxID=2921777 RepID=UPI00202823ED|nr:cellulose biosynthesis protein BcsP [Caballeronia sp. ATUFL_F2_KS9A]